MQKMNVLLSQIDFVIDSVEKVKGLDCVCCVCH